MKTETFLRELEALCEQSGYRIRREKGSFRGDSCVMEGDKLIVINKNRPVESQVAVLAGILKKFGVGNIYLKPAVRKKLEQVWDRSGPEERETVDEIEDSDDR